MKKHKPHPRLGIMITEEERKVLREKLMKYGSSSQIIDALERVNPNILTSLGRRLTPQNINHMLSLKSNRSIGRSIAQTIYKLCGEDLELNFLVERSSGSISSEYLPMPEVEDLSAARQYANNMLYNTAERIMRNVFTQLDETKRSDLINDLEQLISQYQPKK